MNTDSPSDNQTHVQRRPDDRYSTHVVQIVSITCIISVLLVFAYSVRDYYVDDAFIGFQFLRNVMHGYGFVFYPGQRPVEGITNIGWLALIAPFSVLFDIPTLAKGAGLVLTATTVLLEYWLVLRITKNTAPPAIFTIIACVVPSLFLVVDYDFTYFSLAGMETGLLAAVLLFMAVWSIAHPDSPVLAIAGWYAFLIHPEACIVFPVYWIAIFVLRKEKRTNLIPALVLYLALLALTTLARVGYFHAPLPNTYTAKSVPTLVMVYNLFMTWFGRNVNIPFPFATLLIFPILLAGGARIARFSRPLTMMLGSIIVTGLLISVYARQDWTQTGRYFAPYMPATLIVLWLGLLDVFEKVLSVNLRDLGRILSLIFAAGLIVLALFDTALRLSPAQISQYPGYVLTSQSLISPALWLRENLPADAVIATRRIGAVSFYSDRRVFDYMFGLTDPAVARLVAQHGTPFDSPDDKALESIWLQVRPGYLLEDQSDVELLIKQVHGTANDFEVHGMHYHVIKEFPIGQNVNWVLAASY